jgi:hypothetical protein
MVKTKIIKTETDWKDVKNVSRTTVNKKHSEVEATDTFKMKMLISEHSPIRLLKIRWLWEGLKSWISVHYSRSKFECFISTQRSDRTGLDRDNAPQDTPVNFEGEANAQHLIDTARKRLCYCSSNETREQMEDLKRTLMSSDDTYEMGFVLTPNCIYRMACPEFEKCGHMDVYLDHNPNTNNYDIEERYKAYNKTFYADVTKK